MPIKTPSEKQIKTFQNALLHWFSSHGRKNLPWQINKTAYRVWVSEIMLQQTQVQTVIPYFLKFLNQFPTISNLANSDLDLVLSLWAGLGYYARARNLHQAAKIISEKHAGEFPKDLLSVTNLPGIGKSTASAILSISDNQPLAICDGNVKRVLARLHCVNHALNTPSAEKILWHLAESYMPKQNCADYSQAIMDLGATVCTKKQPNCVICPVSSICEAYHTQTQANYPIPKKPLSRKIKYETFLIFKTQTHIALTQKPLKGIWGGLFTPILSEHPKSHPLFSENYIQYIEPQKHAFTHFDLIYDAYIFELKNLIPIENSNWYAIHQLDQLALPTPIRNLLQPLQAPYSRPHF